MIPQQYGAMIPAARQQAVAPRHGRQGSFLESIRAASAQRAGGANGGMVSMDQYRSELQERNKFCDTLVESWSKTEVGFGLIEMYNKNPHEARNLALALAQEQRYLRETMNAVQFQTTPENVLRIVRVGSANHNRGRMFSDWQLTTLRDSVYVVNRTRGKTKRGATAGEHLYENIRPNYGTEMDEYVVGTGTGAQTTFAAIVPVIPLVPYGIRIFRDQVPIGNDDGQGGLAGSGIANTSTVDYATGNISIVFTAAPASGVEIRIEYHWNSEVSSLYGEVGSVELSVLRKQFNARPMPLEYSYTKMVELALGRSGLGDVEEMLVSGIGDEHAISKDLRSVRLGRRVSLGNGITTFDSDFATAGEDSDYNHAQRILSTISDMQGDVYKELKRGQLNVGMAGTKALTYLKKNRLWVPDQSQKRVGGTYLAGTLDGVEIYAVPTDGTVNGMLEDNEVLFNFKNPDDEGDTSIAYGTLTELVAALDFPELYRKGTIATVEDAIIIQPKFLRLLQIDGL